MPGRLLTRSPDADLAEDAAAGRAEAFEELYRRHARAAWRAAFAVTGNADDASDAASEAYARVLKALPSSRLRDGAHFRPYVLAAARDAAIDALRRSGRTCPTDRAEDLDRPVGNGPPEQLVEAVDSDLVARAFRRLPERWQKVLWLTEVEGLSGKEAAPRLGLSPNGVAQLAVRARAGLREGFLRAHLADGEVRATCRFTVEHLAAYAFASASSRDAAKVDEHLSCCLACRTRLAEVRDVSGRVTRSRAA
jgi:RNA polymerase sigma factor (sigma-70 family)